jgi:hypothetical protein
LPEGAHGRVGKDSGEAVRSPDGHYWVIIT